MFIFSDIKNSHTSKFDKLFVLQNFEEWLPENLPEIEGKFNK